jgi:hypothetical protein
MKIQLRTKPICLDKGLSDELKDLLKMILKQNI